MSNLIYSFCEMTDKGLGWALHEEYPPQEEYSLVEFVFCIMAWLFAPVLIIIYCVERIITFFSEIKFKKSKGV